MNRKALSICIATFNRAAFIGATLESIVSQATAETEIVIVDGGSADETARIVAGFQGRFPDIRYFRQETNQGVDRDFNRAVELAQGEYCWLMADDDLLNPGAVQTVLDGIRKGFGLILVNAEVRNADLSTVLEEKRLRLAADRVYRPSDHQQLFIDTADYLSFIGCVVIKRRIWMGRERETYFGTLFLHVGVIFQAPLPEDVLVIAKPLIAIRYGNAQWTGRSFEIWMFKWPALLWSFPDFPDSAKRQVCRYDRWKEVKVLLTYKAVGAFSEREYDEWIRRRPGSRWNRSMAWTIAHLPGHFVNLFFLIYHSLTRRLSPLVYNDLVSSRFSYRSVLASAVSASRSRVGK